MIVAFDLDGTLINSNLVHMLSCKEAFLRRNLPFNEKIFCESSGKFITKIIEEILDSEGIQFNKLLVNEIFHDYIKNFDKYINMIEVYEDCFQVLEELKKRGIIVALCTGTVRVLTEKILKVTNLRNYFDCVVCGDDVKNPKPNPEPLIIIEKILKEKVGFYVGDSYWDYLCAKNYGCCFILVNRRGKAIKEKINCIVVKNLKDVLRFI